MFLWPNDFEHERSSYVTEDGLKKRENGNFLSIAKRLRLSELSALVTGYLRLRKKKTSQCESFTGKDFIGKIALQASFSRSPFVHVTPYKWIQQQILESRHTQVKDKIPR